MVIKQKEKKGGQEEEAEDIMIVNTLTHIHSNSTIALHQISHTKTHTLHYMHDDVDSNKGNRLTWW